MSLDIQIRKIDSAIDDLKKLSVPRGYSDGCFASMLSIWYSIRENLAKYKDDTILLPVLTYIFLRVELQHVRLRRDESFWKNKYDAFIYTRYNLWMSRFQKRYNL